MRIALILFPALLYAQGNEIQLCDLQSSTHCMTLRVPSTLAASYTMILPPANASGVLNNDGSGNLSWASTFVNPMTTLGDTMYGGSAGAVTVRVGDTSNTRKFLRELSVAGVANAPVWDTLQVGDIPAVFLPLAGGTMTGLERVSGGYGNGITISTGSNLDADNYPGSNQFSGNCSFAPTWSSGTTYSSGQIALYSGVTYTSAINGNLNNNPVATLGFDWLNNCTDDRSRIDGFGFEGDFFRVKGKGNAGLIGDYFDFTRFIVGGSNNSLPLHQWHILDSSGNENLLYDGTPGYTNARWNFTGGATFSSGNLLNGLLTTDLSLVHPSVVTMGSLVGVTAATNASVASFAPVAGSYVAFSSGNTGTGTILPLRIYVGSHNSIDVDTSGNSEILGNLKIDGTCTGCTSYWSLSSSLLSPSSSSYTLNLANGMLVNTTDDGSGYIAQFGNGIEQKSTSGNILSKGTTYNAIVANAGGISAHTGYYIDSTLVITSFKQWAGSIYTTATDYSSTRFLSTTYLSSSAQTLREYVQVSCTASPGIALYVYMDSSSPPTTEIIYVPLILGAGGFYYNTVTFDVIPGNYYRVFQSGSGSCGVISWKEFN